MKAMLTARTKLSERVVKAKGHEYRQLIIYVPKDLVKDSQFPFKPGQDVAIRIDDGKLIIEKA